MRTRLVALSIVVVFGVLAFFGWRAFQGSPSPAPASSDVALASASPVDTSSPAEAASAVASDAAASTAPADANASASPADASASASPADANASASPADANTSASPADASASPTDTGSPAATASPVPTIPAEPTGLPENWTLKTERVERGPEADLLVRTGDINNLGYGWPEHFTPFSGEATPPHPYPCQPRYGEPAGTDRIMVGTGVTANDLQTRSGDGYSSCSSRPDNLPQAISLAVGPITVPIHDAYFQIFVDDFQSPVWHSHFQVSLNGTRIPAFEETINGLDQTGPIGKLLTLRLLPEYWPIIKSGKVDLFIDDPTTGMPDGYAIDFVRLLLNPHGFRYTVIIHCSIADAETNKPIKGATCAAAEDTLTTDALGKVTLRGVPAGLVSVSASAVGYDGQVQLVDLPANQVGPADFLLKPHKEGVDDLKRKIAQDGTVAVYGIHFDTASAKLRPDSLASLNEIHQLMVGIPSARWIVSGHTDNQGGADYNLGLSDARAKSVVTWLVEHGIPAARLASKGFGLTRPVADNATDSGRALNRRVEVTIVR